MRSFLRPLATTVVLSSAALAQEPTVPCHVAARLDYATYIPIAVALRGGWSENAEDRAAEHLAECQEAALTTSLARSPRLQARIAKLRVLMRQLRIQEDTLAVLMSVDGSRYRHLSIRSWVNVETFLKSLSALASDAYGGLRAHRGDARLRATDAALARRLGKLRATIPSKTLMLRNLPPSEWRGAINQYEATYRAIVAVVGRQPDVATVAVHEFIAKTPFLDEKLGP